MLSALLCALAAAGLPRAASRVIATRERTPCTITSLSVLAVYEREFAGRRGIRKPFTRRDKVGAVFGARGTNTSYSKGPGIMFKEALLVLLCSCGRATLSSSKTHLAEFVSTQKF